MARTKRQYSEEDKAAFLVAYAQNNNSLRRTARLLGVPLSTAGQWVKGQGIHSEVSVNADTKKGNLAARWEAEASAALEAASGKRGEATYGQLMMGAGLATDKVLALRRDTAHSPEALAEIVSELEAAVNVHVHDKPAREQIATILERFVRRDGQPAS